MSQSQCEWYHRPYRPEEEGRWALPHGEFGLDVIALVGMLRYTSHRSVPGIHQTWRALRSELNHRHEARRMQHRFRKSPEGYLAALEEKPIKERLLL